MALPAYLWITDEKGQILSGETKIQGRENSTEIIGFMHRVYIPVDRDSGLLTGTRKHEPFAISKNTCCLSPILYKACCSGKTLQEVKLSWYRIESTGREQEYFRHTLKNVRVVSVEPHVANIKIRDNEPFGHLETISFRYEKIQWLYLDGNILTEDQWNER